MGRYHIFLLAILLAFLSVSSVFALDVVNTSVQPLPNAEICSQSTPRGSVSRGSATSLFGLTSFQQAYFTKATVGVNLTMNIVGNKARNNNDKTNGILGNCLLNGNHGAWTGEEITRWDSFWSSSLDGFRFYFPTIVPSENLITTANAAKMQEYIRRSCGLPLQPDGKIGILTLNATRICTPPCQGKCGRETFASLKDHLFYDKEGMKPIYSNNAFTNDGNPSSTIMYLKTDTLTSVPEGLDDYLMLSGSKVVPKDENSTNTMQTKIGIGLTSSSSLQEVCPLTPLQVTTINSTPLNDLPNRPIVQLDGPSCFLNNQSKDGKPMTKEEVQNAIVTNTDPQVVSPDDVRKLSFDDSSTPSGGDNTAGGDCSLQGEGVITTNGACKCDSNYKRVRDLNGERCEVCDPVKCNCGVKLNTNVPFIGRCILYGQTNDVGDSNFVGGKDGQGADQTIVVNQLNAFPVLISGLIKILMVLLGLLNFFNLIVGGVQMTIPESYSDGWGRVKGVGIGLFIFGALGVVLYLVNPNFFT